MTRGIALQDELRHVREELEMSVTSSNEALVRERHANDQLSAAEDSKKRLELQLQDVRCELTECRSLWQQATTALASLTEQSDLRITTLQRDVELAELNQQSVTGERMRLSDELALAQTNQNVQQSRITSLEESHTRLDLQLNQSRAENEVLTGEAAQMKLEISHLKFNASDGESKLAQLQAHCENLASSAVQLTEEKDQLSLELEKTESLLSACRSQLQIMKESQALKENELQSLQARLHAVESERDDLDQQKCAIQNDGATVTADLQLAMQDLKQQIAQGHAQSSAATLLATQRQEALDAALQTVGNLHTERDHLKHQILDLATSLQSEETTWNSTVSSLKSQLRERDIDIERFERQLAEMQVAAQEYARDRERLDESLRENCEKLKQSEYAEKSSEKLLQQTVSESEQLKAAFEALDEKHRTSQTHITNMRQQVDNLSTKLRIASSDLHQRDSVVESLEKTCGMKEKELVDIVRKCETLTATSSETRRDLQQCQSRSQELERECKELKVKLIRMESDDATLKEELDRIKVKYTSETEEMHLKLHQSQQIILTKSSQVRLLEKEREESLKTIEELSAAVDAIPQVANDSVNLLDFEESRSQPGSGDGGFNTPTAEVSSGSPQRNLLDLSIDCNVLLTRTDSEVQVSPDVKMLQTQTDPPRLDEKECNTDFCGSDDNSEEISELNERMAQTQDDYDALQNQYFEMFETNKKLQRKIKTLNKELSSLTDKPDELA